MSGQTTYSLEPTLAVAGQRADQEEGVIAGRYACSEDIPFGSFVELHTDGLLRLPKTATAVGTIVGVALYDDMHTPDAGGGWNAGEQVPVLRQGHVWMPYTGTAPNLLGVVRVRSASDDTNSEATHRGKATAGAASAVVGSEIYTVAGAQGVEYNAAAALVRVVLNLPA